VNLVFRVQATVRGLDCPIQEMGTLELTSKGDPWCKVPASSSETEGFEYILQLKYPGLDTCYRLVLGSWASEPNNCIKTS
jgi:hypothetical protein